MPLPSQRALFDIPQGVTYLNAASMTPIPRAGRLAGEAGLYAKVQPWSMDRAEGLARTERVRAQVASLLGATADDIALTGATSYGIATAANNIDIPANTRILVLAHEHPSQVLAWRRRAAETNAHVEEIPRPADDDWAAAILAAVNRPGAPPVAVAALSPSHWTDGARVDLDAVAPELRRHGAALVIDGTQGVGVLDLDVARLQPDFIAFPTYKWILGPYSFGFLYAAPWRQSGQPLEDHENSRQGADFLPGARRYDLGERNNPIQLPITEAGLSLVTALGRANIEARLRALTTRLIEAVAPLGITAPANPIAQVAGLRWPGGLPGDLVATLAARGIHVANRQGTLRVSPHVYNDESDIDHLAKALQHARKQ